MGKQSRFSSLEAISTYKHFIRKIQSFSLIIKVLSAQMFLETKFLQGISSNKRWAITNKEKAGDKTIKITIAIAGNETQVEILTTVLQRQRSSACFFNIPT